ncbi:DUF202 domain-containing protein [Microcoleus sp. FACHB-1515]|uniref:YidH family protein n=1 Tax=Cyanophyceae TaxID=3028117 RepID=UPI00168A37A4|nr:DUF202 domain-containing protein [Microcoleus sp. FACHB-1515]MBD2090122.1 DUF202 domain-containing protein [Microcoleus sp. FACHB-1515]
MTRLDRQREHQANERTYLAWLRTSISLIAFGFAIARFGLFLRQMQPQAMTTLPRSELLGMSLIGLGIATIGLAAWQYNRAYWQIERGNYRPTRWVIWMITIVVILLGSLSLPLLLPPDQPPPPSGREP